MTSRRSRWSLLILSLGVAACADRYVPAIGPNSHISCFSNVGEDAPGVERLQASLRREVYTTRFEEAFHVEFPPPARFDDHKSFKNLFLIASLDEAGPVRDRVRRIAGPTVMGEFERGERPFAVYADVYATGQSVFVVAAPNRERLNAVLVEYADALYDSVEARVRQGLQKTLYTEGEHPSLEAYLRHSTKWTLRLPKMYEVEEDPVHSMIIMHTQSPERWLFVQSVAMSAADFTPERCLDLRRRTPRLYEDEVLVEDVLEQEAAVFGGETGYRFSGRWQSPSFTVGGPFRMYAVYHEGRTYLVDFLVFLPAMDKLPYLRQLDAIAHTFRFTD